MGLKVFEDVPARPPFHYQTNFTFSSFLSSFPALINVPILFFSHPNKKTDEGTLEHKFNASTFCCWTFSWGNCYLFSHFIMEKRRKAWYLQNHFRPNVSFFFSLLLLNLAALSLSLTHSHTHTLTYTHSHILVPTRYSALLRPHPYNHTTLTHKSTHHATTHTHTCTLPVCVYLHFPFKHGFLVYTKGPSRESSQEH